MPFSLDIHEDKTVRQIEYFPEREQPRPRKADRLFQGFKLERGINPPISEDLWNAVKDDPVIVLLQKCDAIKVKTVSDTETPPATPPSTPPKTTKPTKPE